MNAVNLNFIERILRSIQRFFVRKSYLRLYGAMRTFVNELDYYVRSQQPAGTSGTTGGKEWVSAATKLLEEAELAMAKNQIQVGWQCLHAATRMTIFGYSDDRLHQAAIAIQNEASNKFSAWRKKAIDEVLGVKLSSKPTNSFTCSLLNSMAGSPTGIPAGVIPGGIPGGTAPGAPPATGGQQENVQPGSIPGAITGTETVSMTSISAPPGGIGGGSGTVTDKIITSDSLYVAAVLRDEHFENIHYKINLRRANLLGLFIFLVCGLVAIPLLSYMNFFPAIMGSFQTIIAVQLFGILGASMSVALTLTGKSIDSDIPDQQMGSFVTWMRPAIGAVAAIAAYILLQAGFLDNIINQSLKKEMVPILAISFISGFSERLVIGVIERVTKK